MLSLRYIKNALTSPKPRQFNFLHSPVVEVEAVTGQWQSQWSELHSSSSYRSVTAAVGQGSVGPVSGHHSTSWIHGLMIWHMKSCILLLLGTSWENRCVDTEVLWVETERQQKGELFIVSPPMVPVSPHAAFRSIISTTSLRLPNIF